MNYLTSSVVYKIYSLKSHVFFLFIYSSESAGDLGFDPMGQMKGKSAQQINDLKLKEVKNGRLAMIAIMGMFAQNLIFDGKSTL